MVVLAGRVAHPLGEVAGRVDAAFGTDPTALPLVEALDPVTAAAHLRATAGEVARLVARSALSGELSDPSRHESPACSTRRGARGQELAARLVANEADLRQRECEVLVLAAAWADVHDLDPTAPGYEPLVERAVGYGGDGCPDVSEYAVHELGALRGTSSGTAEQLVADALDLRHRHPRLWARVRAGEVRAWQAVHVARTCHHLSREAAGLVDLAVTGHLGQLPWAGSAVSWRRRSFRPTPRRRPSAPRRPAGRAACGPTRARTA